MGQFQNPKKHSIHSKTPFTADSMSDLAGLLHEITSVVNVVKLSGCRIGVGSEMRASSVFIASLGEEIGMKQTTWIRSNSPSFGHVVV